MTTYTDPVREITRLESEIARFEAKLFEAKASGNEGQEDRVRVSLSNLRSELAYWVAA